MEIPTRITLEILEARKNYLILKYQKDIYRNAYLEKEIEALTRAVDFIKSVQNNLPAKFIRVLLKTDENKKSEYINDKEEDSKEHEIKYFYEKYISKYYKFDISFIQTDKYRYIYLEPETYKQEKSEWQKSYRFKLSLETLEELLKIWKEVYKETDETKK